MIINRVWSMPSKHTFTIRPIAALLRRYIGDGTGWIDPFAGFNSPASLTNDLNPETPAMYHLHALDFSKQLQGEFEGVLFDPPYSLTQVKECYKSFGKENFMRNDVNHFPYDIQNEIAPHIKLGGYAITCGWNSNGFGKKRGFEIIEILLVAHGRQHNDTIVTIEKKVTNLIEF